MNKKKINLTNIDDDVVDLVQELLELKGLTVVESTGSHPDQIADWFIQFKIDHTTNGWRVIEFLAWLINHDLCIPGNGLMFYPYVTAPDMSHPGKGLRFNLSGLGGMSANELAAIIRTKKADHYATDKHGLLAFLSRRKGGGQLMF